LGHPLCEFPNMNRLESLQIILGRGVTSTDLWVSPHPQRVDKNTVIHSRMSPVGWSNGMVVRSSRSQKATTPSSCGSQIPSEPFYGMNSPTSEQRAQAITERSAPLLLFARLRPSEVDEWLFNRYKNRASQENSDFNIDSIEPGDCGPSDFHAYTEQALRRHPATPWPGATQVGLNAVSRSTGR